MDDPHRRTPEDVPELDAVRREAEECGREVVVAAVIFDARGRVFTPRRSAAASLLPGLWDLVGGHVEPEESIGQALRREVSEETGWRVVGTPALVHVSDWETEVDGTIRRFREFDLVVEVDGDLRQPRLAPGEHDDFRWVGPDELDLFDENRGRDGGLIRRVVEVASRHAGPDVRAFPHSTLFLPSPLATIVDGYRRRWDPAMALQVGPHVSVAKPHDVSGLDDLIARTAAAARRVPPFELGVGSARHSGDPAQGIAFTVDDLSGGWQALHLAITGRAAPEVVETPHLTVVHPRTSGLGAVAWPELAGVELPVTSFGVAEVAVTAFDGRRWRTVASFGLGERTPLAPPGNGDLLR